MLTRPQVQRYSTESGLRDIMIAEKEVVLTFLLQLLSERGILDRLAFKGGTCLRKMFVGSQGRFSTDLDFTGIEEHDHEEIILDMMQAFEQPSITASSSLFPTIATTKRRTACPGASTRPIPMTGTRAAIAKSSSRSVGAKRRRCRQSGGRRSSRVISGCCLSRPPKSSCLALPEILAEKIRACYQRNKARDIYDLGMFATTAARPGADPPPRGAKALAGARYFRSRAPDAEIRGWQGLRLG